MNLSDAPTRTNHQFYEDLDPVLEMDFASKIRLLQDIDAFARAQGEDVVQVAVGLVGERRGLTILRAQGALYHDTRPLVRLRISISVERNGRRESAQSGGGGRYSILKLANPEFWHGEVVEALRHARINLEARPAPSGEMPVVLGPGWPGVLLHEAVGHGLEGDFNRKGTSAFSGKIGQQVAAKGVTILDDGTIDAARGSINFDDEGTATNATTRYIGGLYARQTECATLWSRAYGQWPAAILCTSALSPDDQYLHESRHGSGRRHDCIDQSRALCG